MCRYDQNYFIGANIQERHINKQKMCKHTTIARRKENKMMLDYYYYCFLRISSIEWQSIMMMQSESVAFYLFIF